MNCGTVSVEARPGLVPGGRMRCISCAGIRFDRATVPHKKCMWASCQCRTHCIVRCSQHLGLSRPRRSCGTSVSPTSRATSPQPWCGTYRVNTVIDSACLGSSSVNVHTHESACLGFRLCNSYSRNGRTSRAKVEYELFFAETFCSYLASTLVGIVGFGVQDNTPRQVFNL